MIIVREHLAGDHLLCSRMLLGWPVTPPPPAREKSRWLVDCNPRIPQQQPWPPALPRTPW